MVKLNQVKTSDSAYKFLDKNGNLIGSCFRVSDIDKKFIINPSIPVSKEFGENKLYICESPEVARERLEGELNCWLASLKEENKKTMKIALDIHGVCDANPEFFVELSRLFVSSGNQVHILTGRRVSDGALEEIKELGLSYTHFFSISDHHRESGTKMEIVDGNPWMDDETWDRTKGDYCKRNNIDFCMDDTERYGKYFETPFAYIKIKKDK